MRTKEYKDGCKGCDISKEIDKRTGGIIELEGDWILNHYAGSEGFLGWMALQPRFHRMDLTDLTQDEVRTLGSNIQNIDLGLRQYWSIRFPEDPIVKVYVVYFHESEGYHLHIHIIPRSEKLGREDPKEYMAWNTFNRTKKDRFPQEYRIMMKDECENWIKDQKVMALMSYLKSYLKTR